MTASHKTIGPAISYEDAMEWLISESDEEPLRWRPIRDCHASRFRELCWRAIAGHQAEAEIRAIMHDLLLRYRQDRWYLCVQLLERGIALPGRAPGKEGLAEWREKSHPDERAS